MLTARAYLRAARHRVPRRIRPFNMRIRSHLEALLVTVLLKYIGNDVRC